MIDTDILREHIALHRSLHGHSDEMRASIATLEELLDALDEARDRAGEHCPECQSSHL